MSVEVSQTCGAGGGVVRPVFPRLCALLLLIGGVGVYQAWGREHAVVWVRG